MAPPFDPSTTAVVTLDCQRGIVEYVAGAERVLEPASQVLAAARAKGLRVIHVGIGFRPGYPEIPSTHPIFGAVKQSGRFAHGTSAVEFHPRVGQLEGEVTVVKHRVGAFHGTDLELILRAQRIEHLIVFGISTSGIVLSTIRHGSDLDFRFTVVKDACFDPDDEIHRVLTEKVFVRQASVVTAAEVVKALQ